MISASSMTQLDPIRDLSPTTEFFTLLPCLMTHPSPITLLSISQSIILLGGRNLDMV